MAEAIKVILYSQSRSRRLFTCITNIHICVVVKINNNNIFKIRRISINFNIVFKKKNKSPITKMKLTEVN